MNNKKANEVSFMPKDLNEQPESPKMQTQQDIEKMVESLLTPTVDALLSEVRTFMSSQMADVTSRLATIETAAKPAKTEQPKGEADMTMENRVKLLESQLKAEQDQREAQEKASSGLRFDKSLSDALDEVAPLHKGIVKEILSNRIKNEAVEKEGQWYSKDGKTLGEATKGFFSTDEGKHFLPSTGIPGAGTKEPTGQLKTEGKQDIGSMLAEAFLNG